MQQGGHQQTEASEQPNSWQQFQLLLLTVALLFPAFLLITCYSLLDNETIFLGIFVPRISGSVDHVLRGSETCEKIDTFIVCILHGHGMANGGQTVEGNDSSLGNLFVFGVFFARCLHVFLLGGCFFFLLLLVGGLYCVCMICGWEVWTFLAWSLCSWLVEDLALMH